MTPYHDLEEHPLGKTTFHLEAKTNLLLRGVQETCSKFHGLALYVSKDVEMPCATRLQNYKSPAMVGG